MESVAVVIVMEDMNMVRKKRIFSFLFPSSILSFFVLSRANVRCKVENTDIIIC